MPQVIDQQQDFSGGMNDRDLPERIGQNQFARGKNLESKGISVGGRRGSVRWKDDGTKFQGAGMYRSPVNGQESLLVVDSKTIMRYELPGRTPTPMTFSPDIADDEVKVRMVQALSNIYLFVGEGTTPYFWDGDESALTVSQVSAPAAGDIMPGASVATYAYNRLWLVTDDDLLNASDVLSEAFDTTLNTNRITQGDGQKIVAIQEIGEGSLLIVKEQSLAIVKNANTFTTANDWQIIFIDSNTGGVAQEAVSVVGPDVFFLSRDGARSVLQNENLLSQLQDIPLSATIEKVFDEIQMANAGGAQSVHFDNYYLVAAPVSGATSNNRIYAFDLIIRNWIGFWEITDEESAETDKLWRHARFLVSLTGGTEQLISINDKAGIAYLLDQDEYKDLDFTQNQCLEFDTGGDMVDLDDMFTDTNLGSRTSGIIEMGYLYPVSGGGNILNVTEGATSAQLLILTGSVPGAGSLNVRFVDSGGTTQWDWTLAPAQQYRGEFHDYRFEHNGTELEVYVDGSLVAGTFTVSVDKTKWFAAESFDTIRMGEEFSSVSKISYISFQGITGKDDLLAHFPIDEGTGTTIQGYNVVANQSNALTTGTFVATPQWCSLSQASDIMSQLITRAYTFGQEALPKRLNKGELTFLHRQPQLDIVLLNNMPFDDETVVTNQTYSLTAYEIKGQADWVADNSNDDFATPFREDYAPIGLPIDTGLNGFDLDRNREHSKFFRSNALAGFFQLQLDNDQGAVRYKAVEMVANARPFAKARST